MSVATGLIERLATVVVIVIGAVLLTALLLLLLPLRADGPLRLAADAGPRDVWSRDVRSRGDALERSREINE